MRALVYHGPGQKAWEEVPDPEITDEGDAIVRVDATTICGTDLHILAGDVPEVQPGTDPRPRGRRDRRRGRRQRPPASPGDRVLVSCISACGTCRFCREGRYGQCLEGGGWVLGHQIDGTQAEYVRVPYADTSTYRIPDGVADEEILMLADILPTGYEVGVLAGGVRPGDVVAVVGAGPIGLSAITCARLVQPEPHRRHRLVRCPARGRQEVRRRHHRQRQPRGPHGRHQGRDGATRRGCRHRGGRQPATFELAVKLARPGGRIANIGVHGKPATLHLEEQWTRDITITTGLVDAASTPTLMRLVTTGQLDASRFITHRFSMGEFVQAYDVFGSAADSGALKVVLTREEDEEQWTLPSGT